MVIDMNESKLDSVEHIREFLAGTTEVAFSIPAEESSRHRFIEQVLKRLHYFALSKSARGVVFAYMRRLSEYSHAQLCRLIAQYRDTESLAPRRRTSRTSFARTYTREDAALLAEVDRLHDTLSGPATKVLLGRAAERFGDPRFARLSRISVSHLYNLRQSEPYRKQRLVHHPTHASRVAIGVRRAPAPEGLPGYIRIDTVHQGDQDGVKGVYHINAVDIVTQWELVACVERISEAYLLPVIALLLEGFPFEVRGFHSDSGSEYVNHDIARLLEKLRIEFTRSRPRHTNDNALAESKNGAIVRKLMGYAHIPQKHATRINTFYCEILNPYLNFHRPCYFAVDTLSSKGKITKTYPHDHIMTPWEKFKSIPDCHSLLKPVITFNLLEEKAHSVSDNEAAKQVQQARQRLFQSFNPRSKSAA